MGLLVFKKNIPKFYSEEENHDIVQAIRQAKLSTSGEIRLFVESKNEFVDSIDRAEELFFKMKMDKTGYLNL